MLFYTIQMVTQAFKSTKILFFLNVCCVIMLYVFFASFWVLVFCTGHFVMVPLNFTYLHCLQHPLFEHLFNLYYKLHWTRNQPPETSLFWTDLIELYLLIIRITYGICSSCYNRPRNKTNETFLKSAWALWMGTTKAMGKFPSPNGSTWTRLKCD